MTSSELMSRIRSKGNTPTELALARVFRRHGVTGWRRQQKVRGISVDFVFKKLKIVVFVDGCFWHGCFDHCDIARLSAYWKEKISNNWHRDRVQEYGLEATGWKVVRIWEHSLKGVRNA